MSVPLSKCTTSSRRRRTMEENLAVNHKLYGTFSSMDLTAEDAMSQHLKLLQCLLVMME